MSSPRPVVAHVFGVMNRGGAELRTMEAIGQAQDVGHVFVTLSGQRGDLADTLEAMGASVCPVALRSWRFPAQFLSVLRSERVTIVHSNVATASGLVLALAALARVPRRIAHFRSDGDGHPDTVRRRLQRRLMRALIDTSATDVLGVSPGALDHGWGRAEWRSDVRCSVVPNGVRIPARPAGGVAEVAAGTEGLVVAHVGRSLVSKRRQLAVAIAAAAHRPNRPVQLLMAGRIEEDERRALEELDQCGCLTVLGQVDDVPALLAQCSALLVTSTREGLPGVVLEALSVGTPVVASDLPGVEYIASCVVGVTVVPRAAGAGSWAAALDQARSAKAPSREAIAESFADGPFTLDAAAARLRAIWCDVGTPELRPIGPERT